MLGKFILAFLCVMLLSFPVHAAKPAAVDCVSCHTDIDRGKSVHPALAMGCESCHTGVNASDVPHKIKTKIAKGLSAAQPELCFGCHDKGMFTKEVVHPALAMGCSTCHNPHASKNAASLLNEPVGKLCVTCHEKQSSGKHIVTRFAMGDTHPLTGRADPLKPNRELSCISCHNPHSSPRPRMFVHTSGTLCLMCHKKITVKVEGP